MEAKEYTGKALNDAITNALIDLETTSDKIEYEVIAKGSNGVFGIGSKPARIKVWLKDIKEEEPEVKLPYDPKYVAKGAYKMKDNPVKDSAKDEAKEEARLARAKSKAEARERANIMDKTEEQIARDFLEKVFDAMGIDVRIYIEVENYNMDISLAGDEMGILIGKRGQTLDSLQYLVSLVVNKYSENYMRVKVDTENYRERRKETLENLARNIAFKVKRTKRPISLEPMNPFERRIIHSALQNDRYVTTRSEGDEPYRHVVVLLKRN